MPDPWFYCEDCAMFYPPTVSAWFTQRDGEQVVLCDECYRG